MIAGPGGEATRVLRAANTEGSPFMYVMDPREQLRIMDEIDGLGRRPAGDLPLAHALGGLPLAHRRRAGLLPRHALPDRVDRRPRRARDPRLPHQPRRAGGRADRRGAGGDRVRRRARRDSSCACAVAPAAACGGSSGRRGLHRGGDAPPRPPPAGATAATAPRRRPAPAACRPRTPSRPSAGGRSAPLPTAQAFVDALYQIGDPARDAARRRLEEGGYADGVLRDQAGPGPGRRRRAGAQLRHPDERRRGRPQEVEAAVEEVRRQRPARRPRLEVPDVEGARGCGWTVSQGGVAGAVVLRDLRRGAHVHGHPGRRRGRAATCRRTRSSGRRRTSPPGSGPA